MCICIYTNPIKSDFTTHIFSLFLRKKKLPWRYQTHISCTWILVFTSDTTKNKHIFYIWTKIKIASRERRANQRRFFSAAVGLLFLLFLCALILFNSLTLHFVCIFRKVSFLFCFSVFVLKALYMWCFVSLYLSAFSILFPHPNTQFSQKS